MKKMNKKKNGFSLAELMIGIAIIGILFAAVVGTFYSIGGGILATRTRTVATNLTAEKLEELKNIPYKRLAVTKLSDLTEGGGPNYDRVYYEPETGVLVGGINYERRVLIKKVVESGTTLMELLPTADDTGLKKITATVLWTENNEQRSISLTTMIDDPDRRKLSAQIRGRITTSTATTLGIPNASVVVAENPNWRTTTDTNGYWSMRVSSGMMSVVASKTGYWNRISTAHVIGEGNTVVFSDIQLVPKTYGNISGFVYIRDHLVISEICPGYDGNSTLEYVELYNPTTYPIRIGDGFNAHIYDLKYITNANVVENFPLWTHAVADPVIPSMGYFLIASVTSVGGVAADGYYTGGAQDCIKEQRRGGVALQRYGVYIDSVAWGSAGSFPSNGMETEGVIVAGGEEFGGAGQGIGNNNVIERLSASGATMPNANGNAFDSNNNRADFALHSSRNPQNSLNSETPMTGTPLAGAVVFASDDLSSPVTTSATGYFTFNMTVATGTWNVSAIATTTAGGFYGATSTFTLTTGLSFSTNVILNIASNYGYFRGGVRVNAIPTQGIKVIAGDGRTQSDASGRFVIPVVSGDNYVYTNPNNEDPRYTSSSTGPVSVIAGGFTDVGWQDIYTGGGVVGRITINGSDGLSDFPITIYDNSNNEVTSVLTDAFGYFSFSNLRSDLNNYRLSPIIETGETSIPTSRTVSVQSGVIESSDTSGNYNSFVVSTLYGKFRGYVKDGGAFIETGVLIVATTSTISAEPINITPSARASLNPNYYSTVSRSDGNYTLDVRGGSTYNLYGWYPKVTGGTVSFPRTQKLGYAAVAGSTTIVNFDW